MVRWRGSGADTEIDDMISPIHLQLALRDLRSRTIPNSLEHPKKDGDPVMTKRHKRNSNALRL